MALVAIAGVNAPRAIPAKEDKYEYGDNNNDAIIHVQDIPTQNPAQNTNLVIPLESDDEQDVALNDNDNVDLLNKDDSTNDDNEDDNDDDDNDNAGYNNDKNGGSTERDIPLTEQEETTSYEQTEQDQGVQRYPRRMNRGVTGKYNR
jgi:hypothetical protein